MSAFNDALNARFGFINTYALLVRFGEKGMDVAVSYYPRNPSAVWPAKTKVWSPTFKTDPQAAWYDYGAKAFIGKRSDSFEKAKQWASEKYGIGAWVTFRGDTVPEYVIERAKAALKEKA